MTRKKALSILTTPPFMWRDEVTGLSPADKADLVSTAYNDALRSAAMFAYVNSLLGDSADLDAIIAAEDKATAAARDTATALGTERSDLIELGF